MPRNKLKLIIIGNVGCGKTSLFENLKEKFEEGKEFSRLPGTMPTLSMEMIQFKREVRSKEYTINVSIRVIGTFFWIRKP